VKDIQANNLSWKYSTQTVFTVWNVTCWVAWGFYLLHVRTFCMLTLLLQQVLTENEQQLCIHNTTLNLISLLTGSSWADLCKICGLANNFSSSCRSHFLVPSFLYICEYWSLTAPMYLPHFHKLAHSSLIVSFHHKLNLWFTTCWHASTCTTLCEFILLGVYKWIFEYTLCNFSFLCTVQ
jgi:hypothetical protein